MALLVQNSVQIMAGTLTLLRFETIKLADLLLSVQLFPPSISAHSFEQPLCNVRVDGHSKIECSGK